LNQRREIVPDASAARLVAAELVMVMVNGPLVLVLVVDFEMLIAPVPSSTTSMATERVRPVLKSWTVAVPRSWAEFRCALGGVNPLVMPPSANPSDADTVPVPPAELPVDGIETTWQQYAALGERETTPDR
jgi:hypothetical protein